MVIYKAFGVLLLVAVKTANCKRMKDNVTRILLCFSFMFISLAMSGLYYNKF